MLKISKIGHPIRVAAGRTGLTPFIIRAWEKRYNAVTPDRTAKNRRLYSDQDIERLALLNEATHLGWRIGEVPIVFENRQRGTSKISKAEIFRALQTVGRLGWERLSHNSGSSATKVEKSS